MADPTLEDVLAFELLLHLIEVMPKQAMIVSKDRRVIVARCKNDLGVAAQTVEDRFEELERAFEMKRVLGAHDDVHSALQLGPQLLPALGDEAVQIVVLFPILGDDAVDGTRAPVEESRREAVFAARAAHRVERIELGPAEIAMRESAQRRDVDASPSNETVRVSLRIAIEILRRN